MRFPFPVVEDFEGATRNFEKLTADFAVQKIPVASSGATLAVGGQFFTTLKHNLNSLVVYPRHCGFQDGAWSHQLGWRWAVTDANTLALQYINVGPNAGAWGFHFLELGR